MLPPGTGKCLVFGSQSLLRSNAATGITVWKYPFSTLITRNKSGVLFKTTLPNKLDYQLPQIFCDFCLKGKTKIKNSRNIPLD